MRTPTFSHGNAEGIWGSQKFSSTTEIMNAMKEMFRDVLQQVMESELDAELWYEKSWQNYRNSHSKKPTCNGWA